MRRKFLNGSLKPRPEWIRTFTEPRKIRLLIQQLSDAIPAQSKKHGAFTTTNKDPCTIGIKKPSCGSLKAHPCAVYLNLVY